MANLVNFPQLYEILEKIKTYINNHTGEGTVQSVSIDGNDPVLPDAGGNVDLDIDLNTIIRKSSTIKVYTSGGIIDVSLNHLNSDTSDCIVTSSYLTDQLSNLNGYVRSVSVNNGTSAIPDSLGHIDLEIPVYSLEVAGGSITASIDGGSPISAVNGNIPLQIPGNYITRVYAHGSTYMSVNNDKSIDLGYTGKPLYNAMLRIVPGTTQYMSSFCVIYPQLGAVFDLYDSRGGRMRIANNTIMSCEGDFYAIRTRYGILQDAILISCTINTISCDIYAESTYAFDVATSIGQNNDLVLTRVSKDSWHTQITAIGLTRDDLVSTYEDSNLLWWKKPLQYRSVQRDTNELYPKMVFDVMGDQSNTPDIDPTGVPFYWLNYFTTGSLRCAQWVFKNCYTLGMEYEGTMYDWKFKLPYYPGQAMTDGWKLIDICIGSTTVTRDSRPVHVTICDGFNNVLIDETLQPVALANTDYAVDMLYHKYIWLRYETESRTYQVSYHDPK